jgi:hypothetical protein
MLNTPPALYQGEYEARNPAVREAPIKSFDRLMTNGR